MSVAAALKAVLPEPVKQPLRGIRNRWQRLLLERWFNKSLTVSQVNRLFRRGRYWYQAAYADNQLISRHNADFQQDERFQAAYQFAARVTGQSRPAWSAYVLLWAAQQAARVPGEFVECGTARGFAAASILSVVDLAALGKRMYLFDSWEGLLTEQLTPQEQAVLYRGRLDQVNREYSGYFEDVRAAFAPFPRVTLVKGYVPQSFAQAEIPQAAFLHIDLNAMRPEVESLRHFWPRLSPGAWVVLDDYGQPGRGEQKRGMDELARELGCEIFSSPTGQGLIVKR